MLYSISRIVGWSARLLTLASTSNPQRSVTRFLWLSQFLDHAPPVIEGDDMGTSFLSCGAVVAAAVVLNITAPESLSAVTGYPRAFTEAVCSEMTRRKLWDAEDINLFKLFVQSTPTDWSEATMWLHDLANVFWDVVYSRDAHIALESLRERTLYGGKLQDWLDIDARNVFHLSRR